jgi:hypothetical protein
LLQQRLSSPSLVGLITVIKELLNVFEWIRNGMSDLFYRYYDNCIFQLMKADPNCAYKVVELAEELHRKPTSVERSLERLLSRRKAQPCGDGHWCLHEYERPLPV